MSEEKIPSTDEICEEEKKKKKKPIFWRIVFIVALIIFSLSIITLADYWFDIPFINIPFFGSDDDFSEYHNDVSEPEPTVSVDETANLPDNPIDFTALDAQNPDVCGWIRIPDTKVDYPILQAGEDKVESFYLNHDINGKYKFAGCIYIQRYNSLDFTDPNTIIYGHNMLNGTMFSDIRKYRKRAFLDAHPNIYVYTPGHILTYEVFSAFVYDDRHILNSFDFYNTDEYNEFLSTCLNPRSHTRLVKEGVEVTTADKIITLSTCTGVDTERYIVIAVLKDDTKTK